MDVYTKMTESHFSDRTNVCWLTGLTDEDGVGGFIEVCHVVDACLVDDAAVIYDPENTIRLHSTLHRAWDSRQMAIMPDGTISTGFSAKKMALLGLTPRSRLPDAALTPKRVAYLKQRINGWNEFTLQKQCRAQLKRQRKTV